MPTKTTLQDQIEVITNDPLMIKYDDYNLAKIAKFIGQDSLDQALSTFKSGQKFSIASLLNRLGIEKDALDVELGAILTNA